MRRIEWNVCVSQKTFLFVIFWFARKNSDVKHYRETDDHRKCEEVSRKYFDYDIISLGKLQFSTWKYFCESRHHGNVVKDHMCAGSVHKIIFANVNKIPLSTPELNSTQFNYIFNFIWNDAGFDCNVLYNIRMHCIYMCVCQCKQYT